MIEIIAREGVEDVDLDAAGGVGVEGVISYRKHSRVSACCFCRGWGVLIAGSRDSCALSRRCGGGRECQFAVVGGLSGGGSESEADESEVYA